MHARFYAPEASQPGELVALSPEEAQHLTRVLRLSAGSRVCVFNGTGLEFDATVEDASKGGVRVRLGERRLPAREAAVSVTLATAVLKSDKMDDVVRDAVMMGVAAIQPLVSERSETSLSALHRGHRRERWERIAVSSAKQCGRAVVPPIFEPRAVADVIAALAAHQLPTPGFILVEPHASAEALSLAEIDASVPREVTVLVGPEGGWTDKEVEQASAACRALTLRGPTLRADAMPIVALTALLARWNEL